MMVRQSSVPFNMDELLEVIRSMPVEVKAVLMGIVEGLTEFLPVSSTGHLILAGSLIGFDDARAKVFDIAIQTGAIVAIIWVYRTRFLAVLQGKSWPFVWRLLIAFIPAAVLGLLFGGWIKQHLFSPVPVAVVLILGGFVILWVERRQASRPQMVRITDVDDMTNLDALKLGLAQSVALIPGTSRSGATIIGGMLFGLSRKAATEFSFFLAVPTLVAAGAYDLLKNRDLLHWEDLPLFVYGLTAAFLSALVVVRWLIRWVSNHNFNGFAYYRIVFGLVVLAAAGAF
jgi:undecaprenyl-diphosphatase